MTLVRKIEILLWIMKNLYSKVTAFIFSLLLIGFIFGTGFFVGNSRTNLFLNSSVDAQEPLDLNSFWKTYNLLQEKFVNTSGKELTDQQKVYGAISGLVESYGDPYTVFFPPTENEKFEETISGKFEGVGMEVGIRDGFLTVIAPLKNSPSEKAGVKSGDKIISIDGKASLDISVEDAIKIIRGPKDTTVTVSIIREGEKDPIVIEIKRDVIVVPTLETKIIGDVFVINLYNFSATASSEFRNALREFVKSKKYKLILDLRDNPGGYLESAVDISSWFLPAGKTVVTEDFGKEGKEKVLRSKGYNIFNDRLRMVVLVNKGSASASEIVAGALKEHGVAKLVGENTFGKGSVQEFIEVSKDTSLKVTVARWLTPEGKSISDGGLSPDYVVELDIEKYKKGKDTQLQKALDILR